MEKIVQLHIPFLSNISTQETCVEQMDTGQIAWIPLNHAPWKEEYPYCPRVEARIVHNGTHIFLQFRVWEDVVRAITQTDNGHVWEDSCCEIFLSEKPGSPSYYNFECNAAGRLLIGYHNAQGQTIHATQSILESVQRIPSLGNQPFEHINMEGHSWDLLLIIPVTALWQSNLQSLRGIDLGGNLYKCGDKLPSPHFLSWAPLQHATPRFHLPMQFGTFSFE